MQDDAYFNDLDVMVDHFKALTDTYPQVGDTTDFHGYSQRVEKLMASYSIDAADACHRVNGAVIGWIHSEDTAFKLDLWKMWVIKDRVNRGEYTVQEYADMLGAEPRFIQSLVDDEDNVKPALPDWGERVLTVEDTIQALASAKQSSPKRAYKFVADKVGITPGQLKYWLAFPGMLPYSAETWDSNVVSRELDRETGQMTFRLQVGS